MQFSQFLPSLPFESLPVSEAFNTLHQRHLDQHDHWSLSASRRKMIAAYWIEMLSRHFFPLWIAGLLIVFLFSPGSLTAIVIPSIPAGVVSFICLLPFVYLPYYHMEFLPQLDNCVEQFRQQQLEGIQKCKKEQYPVLTLLLIEHVNDQLIDCPQHDITDHYMRLLSQKFGVSKKMVESVLRIVKHCQWDRKKIRKRTEITEGFVLARDHFIVLNNKKAIKMLELLERRILA